MVCYRHHGHNEVDEPGFTQPEMYEVVRGLKETLAEGYARRLQEEGVIKEGYAENVIKQVHDYMSDELKKSKVFKPTLAQTTNSKSKGSRAMTHKWRGMSFSQDGTDPADTGYDKDVLKDIGLKSVDIPEHFEIHPRLRKMHVANRIKSINANRIDWATAEAMAMVSLNMQGYNSRLVGEDSERGTFSQRHAVFHNQKAYGQKFFPLLANFDYKK